jgi:hypothetical protein
MNKKNQFLLALLLLLFYAQSYAFEVKIKVFLEGPFQGTFMSTHLNTELKKIHSHAPLDAVDIVQVEIRTNLASLPIETKKAFILKDGTVLDYVTLQPNLVFNASGNAYYIVVKHRNHLPIASKTAVNHQSFCDLTVPSQVYGEAKLVNGKSVMIAGNVHNEPGDVNEINASDFYMVSKAMDEHFAGYVLEDANLDGIVNEKDFQLVKNNAEKLYFSQIP